jgi:zinc protease
VRALTVALIALAACGGAQAPQAPAPVPSAPSPAASAPETPDAPFRASAPSAGPAPEFRPPTIREARLPNGVRVLAVTRSDLPIVAFDVTCDHGADQAAPGVASFYASMLENGTRTKSADAISDAWRAMAAIHEPYADFDAVGIAGQVIAPRLEEAVVLAADLLMHATFPKDEMESVRRRRAALLAQERDAPEAMLDRAVAGALFGAKHPYGTPVIGTLAANGAVSAKDLAAFARAHVVPERVSLVVSGAVTLEQAKAIATRAFAGWQGRAKPPSVPAVPLAPKEGARIVVLDRPGAAQSQVAVADVAPSRISPDYDALAVMNTVLGGPFSSRINLNLREKHAYTYGAGSSFELRRGPGVFATHGAIVADKTGDAVRELLAEVARVGQEPVTDEELATAKSYLVGRLPSRFESNAVTAGTLASLAVLGLPLDEYASRAQRIGAVTRDDVLRVAKRWLHSETVRVIVVGDAKVVKPGLESLKLGAVEVRTP